MIVEAKVQMAATFMRSGIITEASTTAASVTADQVSYSFEEVATVTVNHGLFGLEEWVGLWLASDPDSAFSYPPGFGNWKYLNGTHTAPTTPPTYPVILTFTMPSEAGSFNFRYFREVGVANRLAISDTVTISSITSDKLSYITSEAAVVTVHSGLYGLQEWVGLWIASNPDSSYSYLSNWQYLNGTQTAPTTPPVYPVILDFTMPSTTGTFNFRYFRENSSANRLAISQNVTVSGAFTADYYASPTGAGSHSGLNTANAMQISEFWSVAAPGISLGLMNGTYTGANSMLNPTSALSGTSGNPITIRAINDGQVLIDGELTRKPCYLHQSDWFVIEGINFKRGGNGGSGVDTLVVHLSSGANNNIFRRCGAWDAYDDGLPRPDSVTDPVVWGISGSSNNLFEDCFGFGSGRYVFYTIAFSGTATGNICRRCWFRYDHAAAGYSSPRATTLPDYTGDETILMESCILEWSPDASSTYPGDAPQICLEGAGYNYPAEDRTGRLTIRGCLFFVGPASQNFLSSTWAMVLYAASKHTDINELTIYIDPANSDFGAAILAISPNSPFDGQLTNVITIGTNADTISSGWSPSNVNHYSTTAACPNPYIFLTYGWVNGTITSTSLWPWPMRQRIIDATSSSSWPTADVHADVQAILGTLP